MDQLLSYIEAMTRGRERPALELALAEALLVFLGVEGVKIHKCNQATAETFVWLAVEASKSGNHIYDDGMLSPDAMVTVEQLPLIKTFIQTGLPDAMDERTLLPMVNPNSSWYGFIEIVGEPLNLSQLMVAGRLVAVFQNMIALLEYSEVDTLTGLLNRKTFDEYLMRILTSLAVNDVGLTKTNRPRRRRTSHKDHDHWLAVIDIDHFKRINDNFGHSIGDEVLILLGTMMKTAFRAHDKLFRFGGEEFVVLLKPTEAEHAQAAFERFRQMIEARNFPLVGRVTVSIGYARIKPSDQPTAIFGRADETLYWVKEHGRNGVANYEALIASGELTTKHETTDIEYF